MLRKPGLLLAAATVALALCSNSTPAAERLTLEQAISRALSFAPARELAIAQNALDQAKVVEARAPLFPAITANGEYNQAPGYDPTITNRGLTLAQLQLGYTAFDGGRRLDLLQASRYAAQASALGIDTARAQIVFDTTVAYFDLLRERETASAIRASSERLDQYLKVIHALQRSGRAIASDALTVQVAHDATEVALANTQQAVDHAAIVLSALIGEPGRADLEIAAVTGLPPEPTGEITASPAFRAAERQLAAAASGIDAAEAERYPTLKLALTSGFEGIDPPNTFDHRLGASYDGAVSVPIFSGGLIRSHIDEAKATRQIADAQLRSIEVGLKRDFADALMRYRNAHRQLEILRRSRLTASDAFALDWTRFLGGGSVTLLEVVSTYQQAQTLQTAVFDNEFAARQAAAQTNLILGVAQ